MGRIKLDETLEDATMEIPAGLAIDIIGRMYDKDADYGRVVSRYLANVGIDYYDDESFQIGMGKLTNAQLRDLLYKTV